MRLLVGAGEGEDETITFGNREDRHDPAIQPAKPRLAAAPDEHELELIAYRLGGPPMRLVPASSGRAWMDGTVQRFAYRCLPMLVANQAGWFVLNSHTVRVAWSGGDARSALRIEYLSGGPPYPARSLFGHGILTWHIAYLFRTPPGYNLLARGPANWPKHGAGALEGLVETDWSVAPFMMNWKLTGINQPVIFAVGEPICMLVPQRRGELEAMRPKVREIVADEELNQAHEHWQQSRWQFLVDQEMGDPDTVKQGWQKDYFRGVGPDGTSAPEHQLKLTLREFDDPNGWCPIPGL